MGSLSHCMLSFKNDSELTTWKTRSDLCYPSRCQMTFYLKRLDPHQHNHTTCFKISHLKWMVKTLLQSGVMTWCSGHNQLPKISGAKHPQRNLICHSGGMCDGALLTVNNAQELRRVGFPCHLCLQITVRVMESRTILCWLLKLLRSDMCYFPLYSIDQRSHGHASLYEGQQNI